MHGQSAGPFYTQQRHKRGRGGKQEETKTFGLICRSGQQKLLWYVFSLHGCAGESTTV